MPPNPSIGHAATGYGGPPPRDPRYGGTGAGRGGATRAFAGLADADARVTAIGIEGDILYGPAQVRSLVDAARGSGVDARYREIRSSKGHDAFLVEWDQLGTLLREALGG